MIYMDNAATTRITDSVFEAMLPYLKENYGNPSAIYSLGQRSRAAIENSRIKIAELLGVKASEIYFTSSGSESDNWALKGSLLPNQENHLISSRIEHPAVLNSLKKIESWGGQASLVSVDAEGFVDLREIENSIKDSTRLISIMFVNNEIGTIEPLAEISKIAREKNILFHTDAVQAIGNIKFKIKDIGVDMLSLSGHKLGAPKGVGVLYLREGIDLDNFLDGGEQERGRRASTENLASIVGLARAMEDAYNNIEDYSSYTRDLRDYTIEKLLNIDGIILNGPRENRLPGNINITLKNTKPQTMVQYLDMFDICVSSGSACAAGSINPSHVLRAIGRSEEDSLSMLRLSLNHENTKEECDYVVEKINQGMKKFKNR
ncbi:MAG: cysteine desulfurase family protein [Peptoniphilus harei]|uniref:cysteine desulfurase n=2 Tax=Peptoniphilus TaxID=162289 RepID=E4KXZ1_9FIRM|nr:MULTISPECIES: cysteine desulfurase family protein [Peptoniphilus]EFR33281.1 putative cysteine desulfurase NifS [Peptoniphilus harei ACS-146-V-Sch2b]MDK7755979.1 cysteine desulfurase family protein [Peptoniphilus harei]MDK7761744.1 cysteine desulfurase family protein [Peptoniphilus harei]MDK8271403.1 cysteine desulfurase family protein [Peptoniphilus harei]MDK8339938.1 cysteine desulfurase family protein [Peptoniphilus harei]